MDVTVKGIVLRNTEINESDMLCEIYTLELGKISAKFKSVRKANSKMKLAKEPFAFAEFSLFNIKNTHMYNVKGVEVYDSFFSILEDYEKYQEACKILSILRFGTKELDANHKIFISAVNAIRYLTYECENYRLVVIKFIMEFLRASGFEMNFSKCNECSDAFGNEIYFDFSKGEFLCSVCKNEYAEEVSKSYVNYLKLIYNSKYDKLDSIKMKSEQELYLMSFMVNVVESLFEISLTRKSKK